MRSRAKIGLMFMLGCAFIAGCASHPPQNKADLKAIGENVCTGHGGLSLIDPMYESAIYSCKDGMTFQVATKPFL